MSERNLSNNSSGVLHRSQSLSPDMKQSTINRTLSQEDNQIDGNVKDYHRRNIELLSKIQQEKVAQKLKQEEEQRRLEQTRQRLARIILKRGENAKRESMIQPEEPEKVPTPPPLEEEDSEEARKRLQLKRLFKQRQQAVLKQIQEQNRQKQLERDQEEKKRQIRKRILQKNLGLENVTSKLYTPTQASQASASTAHEEGKINEKIKGSRTKINTPNERKENPCSKEDAERIMKKAQDYISQLVEKRNEEAMKESLAREKEEKSRQAVREAVLKMTKTKQNDTPKSILPDIAPGTPKKPTRRYDEKAIQKLSQPPKRHEGPIITDMGKMKKRYKLEEGTKVFIIKGGYPDIKRALLKRGWFQNPDKLSPCFDLKWTLKRKDIDFKSMDDTQICNHFEKSSSITTKSGLSRNLKNLIWFANVDIDTFYPKCFDLRDPDEMEEFITEFKLIQAENIVKLFVTGQIIAPEKLQAALRVCERRLLDLDDIIDSPNIDSWQLITEDE